MSMTLFDSPSFAKHEGVHSVFDEKTGLRAIIAVHSTARGPAVGGTRMWDYARRLKRWKTYCACPGA